MHCREVTLARECPVHGLSVNFIIQKVDIDTEELSQAAEPLVP